MNTSAKDGGAVKLSDAERRLLSVLAKCEPGKGIALARESKRTGSSLIRKGFAWSLSSIFTVLVATDEGRAALARAEAPEGR